MLCTLVGFVHFYIFTVIVGVLNSVYCNVCSTVRYLACNCALIKCFIFQWLVVLIVCHRWHKSWSHVQDVRWCAINWLVFVTGAVCLLRGTDCVFTYNSGQPQSLPTDCIFVYEFSSPMTVPFVPSDPSALLHTACAVFGFLANSSSGTRTF